MNLLLCPGLSQKPDDHHFPGDVTGRLTATPGQLNVFGWRSQEHWPPVEVPSNVDAASESRVGAAPRPTVGGSFQLATVTSLISFAAVS
jgi:hypothetical protein